MPVVSFGCGGRSEGLGKPQVLRLRRAKKRASPLRMTLSGVLRSLIPGLGFVFGEVGGELADEELLKEILDGAAGDSECGVFEG
jgi:hypothetical protein